MKLEESIARSIYNYPCLYRGKNYGQSKLFVLDHLFFVIGNGYEWHDGYLAHIKHNPKTQKILKPLPYGKEKFKKNLNEEYFKKYLPLENKGWDKELYKFLIKNKKKLPDQRTARPQFHFYPLCENYSVIFTLPDNIKWDWLMGAKEIYLKASNYYKDINDDKNLKLLEKAAQRINYLIDRNSIRIPKATK